jgi:hypothetical protein
MSNEQTIWARYMEDIQQQEKALEDRWKRDRRERIAGTALEDRWKRDRRERIAGTALQGMLAYDGGQLPIDRGAVWAVAHADALIAELDKPKEDKT